MIKRLLIAALLLGTAGTITVGVLTMESTTQRRIEEMTREAVALYDIPYPRMDFTGEDMPQDAMGMVSCLPGARDCVIAYHPCVATLNRRYRDHLTLHETAHYINAVVNELYDHGDEWREIVHEIGGPRRMRPEYDFPNSGACASVHD